MVPASDEVKIIRPDTSSPAFARLRQYVVAKRAGAMWPLRWTRMTASHSSSSMLKLILSRRIPALFTRTCSPPSSSTACWTMCSAPDQDATSSEFTAARPPAAWISATTSPAGVGSKSFTSTAAPSEANSNASSRPMPRPAPVTIATLPSNAPMPHPSCPHRRIRRMRSTGSLARGSGSAPTRPTRHNGSVSEANGPERPSEQVER